MESETMTLRNACSRSKKSFDSLSILVVDDDTTCLSIVAAMLKKFKYEVVTVKHPNDALCALRIKGDSFDLVVSDVHMPDMNGFELQKVIAREFDLPVILMSADNEEGVVLKGLQNGAAFFILKPVSADDLRDLWQFASMNYDKKNQVLMEEKTSVDEIIDVSETSVVDEDGNIKKESRKCQIKEGSADERRGEVCESSAQKRPKVVWTGALHNRFLDAIRSIGFDRAVPKKILEVMNVPGLTRENVASHLQKYRIFLRRVSDASYKIDYATDLRFNRNFRSILTSSQTNPSILMLNNFRNNKHQNPGQFPGKNNGIFFQNQEATSSRSGTPGIEQSRILSHSGRFLTPNLTNPGLLIQDTDDLSHISFAQSDHLSAASGMEDLSAGSLQPTCFQTSSLSSARFNVPSLSYEDSYRQEISVLTNDTTFSTNYNSPSKCLAAYQTNYVGLRMSNLKQLTESSLSKTNQGMKPCSGVVTIPGISGFQGNMPTDQDFSVDDTGLDRLLQSIGDSSTYFAPDANGKQLSDVIADYQMLISTPNIGSLISGMENGESVFGPDLVALDHTMSSEQSLQESGFRTSLTDEVQFQNQGQQNSGKDTISSLDFNAPSQFSTSLLSSSEREDQEFLASLLASDQFGAEQTTLDGMGVDS